MNWLIRLLGKVALPSWEELLHVVLLQLLFGRSDLHPCLNTFCSKRARAIDIPLIEDSLLSFGITTEKVVETFGTWFRTIGGKGKVVILEIETDTREVDFRLNADLPKSPGIANTRALEHKRGAERSAGDDNLLAGSDLAGTVLLVGIEGLHRADLYSSGSVTIKDDFIDLSILHEVEIVLIPVSRVSSASKYTAVPLSPHCAVDVGMSGVTATTRISVDPLQPVLCTVTGDQVLKVIGDGNILRLGSTQEILSDGICIISKRYFDWTLKAVNFTVVTSSLVCLVLFHQ